MDRYGVIGQPIAHSRSPQIHALFAQETGQNLSYERIGPPVDHFEQTVLQFMREGGCGLNVTLPFKERALAMAHTCSERAMVAGAANTLVFQKHNIHADNTDGVGLVRDLTRNLGFSLANKHLLLIGAGGAARGVILPLLQQAPARLVLSNRTLSRAQQLLRELADCKISNPAQLEPLTLCALDEIPVESFDLVLNATSATLTGGEILIPADVFGATTLAYDMLYSATATPFMQLALRCGVRQAVDGLGMLVEQAAESFRLWRGIEPYTASVLQQLRHTA